MTAGAPASRGQEQLWLADQAAGHRPANNVPHAWHLYGPLDRAALQRAMDGLVARHTVLRTLLRPAESELRQVVTPARPVPIVALAPDGDPAEARDGVPSSVDAFTHRPFDLAGEWPVRVGLVSFGAEHHLLVMVLHHIICDGVTSGLLQRNLAEAYESAGAENGRPAVEDGHI
jgi:hypothetical protein